MIGDNFDFVRGVIVKCFFKDDSIWEVLRGEIFFGLY